MIGICPSFFKTKLVLVQSDEVGKKGVKPIETHLRQFMSVIPATFTVIE